MWEFFYSILGVVKRLGPIVPLVDDLVGERAASRVVPTISIVNFLHHPPSLLQTEASQIKVGMEAEVGFFLYSVSLRSMYRVAKC